MSDLATLDDVNKKQKTVPVHCRLAESDVAEVDRAAESQPIPVSRSHMIALIVRQWILTLQGIASPPDAGRGKANQGDATVKRRLFPKRK